MYVLGALCVLALGCAIAGLAILGRAGYRLYVQVLRIEASTLVRAPIVLQSHLDRIERSRGDLDGLLLRMRRALHSIDESTRALRKTARLIGTTVNATRALFGAVPSPWKKLGN